MYTLEFGGKVYSGLESMGAMALRDPEGRSFTLPAVLQDVTITCTEEDDPAGLAGKHERLFLNCEMVMQEEGQKVTHILFRDPSPNELEMIRLRGDMMYLAMMLGVDLDG